MVAVMNPQENLAQKPVERYPERFVILENIGWETYQRLQADHPDSAGPRFTYDQGRLQIMVLSLFHEEINRTLAQLVEVLAEEFDADILRAGSTTFDREDLLKGFEPDSCFYFQSAGAIRGKEKIDLNVDPPPDLIIEIDISSDSLNKFPVFAAVGAPEVWRFNGNAVIILQLENGQYVEARQSLTLPPLTSELATKFLEDSRKMASTAWLRRVREWAREQSNPEDQQ